MAERTLNLSIRSPVEAQAYQPIRRADHQTRSKVAMARSRLLVLVNVWFPPHLHKQYMFQSEKQRLKWRTMTHPAISHKSIEHASQRIQSPGKMREES